MQITIELTEKESNLIHTFIRRTVFEDFIRPMQESGDTKEQTLNRVYETISAMQKIRNAIEDN